VRFRVPLTDEALEVLRRAFTGEKFSFEGKRYNFQDVKITPGFVQPGDPPLWVAASGRNAGDFRIGIIRSCLVTDDPARDWVDVRAAERRRMEVYNRFREAAGGHGGVAGITEEERIPQTWVVGDVDHCVAELSAFIREYGLTDLVTWGVPPGMRPDQMAPSLERFARDVAPRLRAEFGG